MAIANSARTPVKLKMRGDLTANMQQYQGVEFWVVKEPLGQKYYQFPPHVYFLLTQLDGKRSVEDIIEAYHNEYSPKRIDRDQLQQLFQRFHRDGLVISDLPGQGPELLTRGTKSNRMELFSKISNVLAVRFRGVDPDRLLDRMNPYTSWLFTKTAGALFLALGLVALFSVLANWTEFQSRLPGFQAFFDWRKWYLFAGVLAFTKICHEFGHGLSCKKFGGECHEIGFMLLVMTPCLYCNVSDSWRLPSKWQRAAIGAAGMYVEVILATFATFVWWFVEPGIIQEICLQIMLVSSISTILFNGNPLLRFDGYYIMSDLLEIPNLHQKSNTALNTLLGRHWLGIQMPDDPLLPRNRMAAFAAFTVAAFLYRFFVLFSILMFLTRWLEPYGLETIGQGIAWFSLLGMVGWPSYKLYRFMSVPGRMMQMKPKRFSIVTAIAVVVIGALFFVPFPSSLNCRVIVVPTDLESVYAQEGGVVRELFVKDGDQVEVDQPIASIQSLTLEYALAEKENELNELERKRDSTLRVVALSATSSQYVNELAAINKEIAKVKELVGLLQRQLEKLKILSPIKGTVVSTPLQNEFPGKFETPLLDPQPILSGNLEGVMVARGQRLCEVANFENWEAIILLTERQKDFTRIDQNVRFKLHAFPGETIETKISSIGVADRIVQRAAKNETADNLQARVRIPDLVSELVSKTDQESVQYIAKAPIDRDSLPLQIGLDGQCRIKMPNRSLAQRLWWWFSENFGT
ncbi:MAG: biotin/lipoyl-binding protein [Pirellulaceae bacterium]